MMKRHIIPALLLSSAAICANAKVSTVPSDRIDAYTDSENFSSVLVDDIVSITYEGNPLTGYTHVVVTTNSQTIKLPLDNLHRLTYNHVNATPHEIVMRADEHSAFRLYLNFNDPSSPDPIDPDKPYGWRGGVASEPVFFLPVADKGFRPEFTIAGQYSGYDYTSIRNFAVEVTGDFTAQFGIGLDCFMYTMPFEPVTMTIKGNEMNDYEGMEILGKYSGARIDLTEKRMASGSSGATSIEFKANTTFEFTSKEGDENISQIDYFTYNEDKKTFAHVPDKDDVNKNPVDLNVVWGIDGSFTESGLTFIQSTYMPNAVPENNRHYVVSRTPFTYTLADADDIAYRRILEVKPENGSNIYTLIENYGSTLTPLSAEFTVGSSIADAPSKAYFSINGQRAYRYVRTSADEVPEIIAKGNEAGSYSGENGALVLDGFGEATYRGESYFYDIDGAAINITDANGEIIESVIIDTNNHTYKIKAAAKWDGAKVFTTTTAPGSCKGGDVNDFVTITLTLDRNFKGEEAIGNAIVYTKIPGEDATIDNQGDYVYDDTDMTLTVSNIPSYIKVSNTGDIYNDFDYARRKLVFHISEDGKSVWLGNENIGDKFYLTRTGSYVVTGESCMLKAEGAEQPEVDITGTYEGIAVGRHETFEMDCDAPTALTITESNATLSVTAMGVALLDFTGEYTFDGTTLTLKGVDVGNGDKYSGITEKADIIFTYADGKLTGSGKYFGANSFTCALTVDLSTFSAERK